jgi:hypothetical protein
MAERHTGYRGGWLLAAIIGAVIAAEGSTHKGEFQILIGILGVLIGLAGYLGLPRLLKIKGAPVRLILSFGCVGISIAIFVAALTCFLRQPGWGFIAIPVSLLLVALFWAKIALFWAVCVAAWQILRQAFRRR